MFPTWLSATALRHGERCVAGTLAVHLHVEDAINDVVFCQRTLPTRHQQPYPRHTNASRRCSGGRQWRSDLRIDPVLAGQRLHALQGSLLRAGIAAAPQLGA